MNTKTATRFATFVDKENIPTAPTPKRNAEAASKRAFGTNISNIVTPSAPGKSAFPKQTPTNKRPLKSSSTKKSASRAQRPKLNLEDDIEYMPPATLSDHLAIPKDIDFDLGVFVRPLELPCLIPPAGMHLFLQPSCF